MLMTCIIRITNANKEDLSLFNHMKNAYYCFNENNKPNFVRQSWHR
ncbi:protein of unknown function [Vibrio tapetis subsp. tapetis]|uniref:Uncharacterized protein n=1 Tax=Vibrio tapetis subsp. tapetis TaxID=1671868 RepID=A0A2N8ZIG3_9VIBR|nr:protein of unknown function [Vibrio tapetis subsp. tapetis]